MAKSAKSQSDPQPVVEPFETNPATDEQNVSEEKRADENQPDPEPTVENQVEADEVSDVEDDYNPFNDPDVPSSVVAQAIDLELKGGQSHPTLDAVRAAKADK